jgi:hypothetical protein
MQSAERKRFRQNIALFNTRNCTKGQVSTHNKQVFLYCVNYSIRPLSLFNFLLACLTALSHLKA